MVGLLGLGRLRSLLEQTLGIGLEALDRRVGETVLAEEDRGVARHLDDPTEARDLRVDVDRLCGLLGHLGRAQGIERHRERDDLLVGRDEHGVRAVVALLCERELLHVAADLDRVTEHLSISTVKHLADVTTRREEHPGRPDFRDHHRLLTDRGVASGVATEVVHDLQEVVAVPREVRTRRAVLRVEDDGRETTRRTLHEAVLVEEDLAELAQHLRMIDLGALEAVVGRRVLLLLADRRDERDRLDPITKVLVEIATREGLYLLLGVVHVPLPVVADRENRRVPVFRLGIDIHEDRLALVADLVLERADRLIERAHEQDEGNATEDELLAERLTHVETSTKYGLSTSGSL